MKTTRIVSLLLALLMIVTALPLTAMITFAADNASTPAAQATGTPGELPSTLPSGKTFVGTPLHDYDAAAKWRTQDTWYGGFGTGVFAMLQDGAEGIVFKVDTTNADAVTSDILSMTFAISLIFTRKDGTSGSTYIVATPLQAAGWSGNTVTTAEDVSTWYYSQDGASWSSVSATGKSGTNVNIPVGKQVTYVFVPMDAFWTKEGETFLKTGTNVKTDRVVNWLDAREMIEDNYSFGSIRYLFTGVTSPAKDTNVSISNWQIVDHVAAVSDMVTTQALHSMPAVPNWTGGSYYVSTAPGDFKQAKGLLFELDSTGLAAGAAAPAFNIMMAMNKTDGIQNAYLLSTFGQANGFGTAYATGGSGDKASDQSSILYWSEDGVNWTAISGAAANSTMPKSHTKAYIYIPFESFWSRHAEKDISGIDTDSAQRVDKNDMVEALGNSWSFAYIHTYWDSTNTGIKMSNWRFVYDTTVSDQAPYKMTDGSYYTTKNLFKNEATYFTNGVNTSTWYSSGMVSATAIGDALNNAEGIMFKVDASALAAGSDKLGLWMMMKVFFTVNGQTKYTYVQSHGYAVRNYGGSFVRPTEPSVWYYSSDGIRWEIITDTQKTCGSITANRGEGYVYIPFSSMYTREGASFFKTGTNVATETAVSFTEARELVGSWNASAISLYVAFENNNMKTSHLNNFQFVYKSDVAPTVPSKDNLPVVGTTLMNPVFDEGGYTIPKEGSVTTSMGTMNFKDSEGILIEVDTTAITGTAPLAFTFAISANTPLGGGGNNNYFWATTGFVKNYQNATVPADAISVWYWSEDGVNWKAYTSDATTDYMTLNAKRTKGYIYIPFTSFWSRYTADYISGKASSSVLSEPSISYADYIKAIGDNYKISYFTPMWNGMNTAGAKLTNWCYVDLDRTMADAEKAPATLPDGKQYATIPMFSTDYSSIGYSDSNAWQSAQMLSSAMIPANFEYANGVMMRVDTSAVAPGTDVASLAFAFVAYLPNGDSTYICSSVGLASSFSEGVKPESATSTWYISNDGKNWTTLSGRGSQATLSAQRGILYLYIPTSSMYVKCGQTYLTTGAHRADEPVVPYAEANALVGGFTKFGMVNVYINDNTVGKGLTISDVNLVGTPLGVFQNASISMTNSLAYNLYTKLPAGAENAQVVFTMGEKTYTSYGIVEGDGRVRYTFSGILPQDLGKPITMTWTATVEGKEMTEIYTDSILLYLNKILREDSLSAWHNLAKALLHYGAAAQEYKAVLDGGEIAAEDLVNDGIGATTAPVDVSKLPWTGVNYAPDVWKSYALRLDSSLQLKVGVNAPAGISKVFYTVGERSGLLTIKNGYVYVPVHAYEIMESITLHLWGDSGATMNGAFEVSVSAYVKSQYEKTDNENLKALLQAIANYAQEATLLAGNRTAPTLTAPTLTQIELEKGGGMCYVIQLTDGRFIVIDGGTNTATHAENLWRYLVEKSGYSKPVIALWMFSHQHGDHVDNAFNMLQTMAGQMEVQAFAYSFVAEKDLNKSDQYDSEEANGGKTYAEFRAEQWKTEAANQAIFNNKIKPLYPNATYWDMKQKDVRTFGDVEIKILLDASIVCRDNVFELNDFSAAWTMTFAGGTKFMIFGDCSQDRLTYLRDNYAADLDCDILQATHHGLDGGDKSTYLKVTPTISLISTRHDVLKNDYAHYYPGDLQHELLKGGFNTYLSEVSTIYYNDQAPIITIGANGSTSTILWADESVPSVEIEERD